MSERLFLVTGNPNKAKVATSEHPTIEIRPPEFREEKIKAQFTPVCGTTYHVGISREKLRKQKEGKNYNPDDILITTDSIILLPSDDNQFTPLNRDSSEKELSSGLELIQRHKEIIFSGAVSFGPMRGPILTTAPYVRIKLQRELTQLPIPIDCLPEVSESFELGFITFNPKGKSFELKPTETTHNFEKARPYISGLTPEVIRFIKEFSQINAQVGPILRQVIAQHPFNTISFYTQNPDYSNTNMEYWLNWVEFHGGNCSLLTLKVASELSKRGLEPQIVIFPSSTPNFERGHSAAIITINEEVGFLLEPGLSIPFPIPYSPQIPLLPFNLRNGKREMWVGSGENLNDLYIYLLDKDNLFSPSTTARSIREFLSLLPQILAELHIRRKIIKIDFHTEEGILDVSARIDFNGGQTTLIKDRKRIKGDFETIAQLLNPTNPREFYILNQLNQLRESL